MEPERRSHFKIPVKVKRGRGTPETNVSQLEPGYLRGETSGARK
jgi:hypothetical protein